jgi:hypothetical protein
MYQRVLRALEGVRYENKQTPVFAKALEWVSHFPPELDVGFRRRLVEATCHAFNMTEAELWLNLDGVNGNGYGTALVPALVDPLKEREDRFRDLLPKGGWFEWYDEFTKGVEIPLSYSIFSGLCAVGASLGRRVYLRMGHFNIWANYCIILIGPPGLKKTTAGDISSKLIRESMLCPCLADQVTPERMITVLKESGHHFIYAGEMAVFFGKQKYNEGLVTKMLRILDSPAEYIAETQTREQEVLKDLAVTFLGCTTPSLLSHSMPEEVMSGGFLSRFLLVPEKDTHREFHIPLEPPEAMRVKLMRQLERLKGMAGEMSLSAEADSWLKEWYHQHKLKMRMISDESMVDVLVRTPTHMLRTAMLVHLVQCDSFAICRSCLETASKLVAYLGESAPRTVQAIKQTSVANDMDYVIATLLKLGGAADHSTMIRRVANKMNSSALRAHIKTLEEGGRVRVGKKGGATYYVLIQEGEDG